MVHIFKQLAMNLDSNLLSTYSFFSSENGNSYALIWQNSKKFGLNKYAAKIEISAAHVLCLSEFQELVAVQCTFGGA